MDQSLILLVIQLLLLAGLLVSSAFFAGAEVALFSLTRLQLEQMRRDGHPQLALIQQLLSEPRRLIVTILIGNELVNVSAANLSTILVMELTGGEEQWWLNILILLPILLFCDITPKPVAVRNNVALAGSVSRIVQLFGRLILPLHWLVRQVAEFLTTRLIGKGASKGNIVTEDMVRTLAQEAAKKGVLDETESVYINKIFDFGNQTVEEVMTPRTNIVFLAVDSPLAEVLGTYRRTRLSRAPVYDENRDHIIGVLHFRDLMRVDLASLDTPDGLRAILHKPLFVPETKPLADLFRVFRERRLSIAFALDEYGGVTGLVTMEDLLETIFGDIPSESEAILEEGGAEEIKQGCFRVDGILSVSHFNQRVGAHLDEGVAETLAGVLLHYHGELPALGEIVKIDDWQLTVTRLEGTRIVELLAHQGQDAAWCETLLTGAELPAAEEPSAPPEEEPVAIEVDPAAGPVTWRTLVSEAAEAAGMLPVEVGLAAEAMVEAEAGPTAVVKAEEAGTGGP